MASKPLTIAVIGCGSRGRTYASLAAPQTDRYRIVAGADPDEARVAQVKQLSGNSEFSSFGSYDELLAADKLLANIVIIATQDKDHIDPCLRALEGGYDVLLEKPAATKPEEVVRLVECAKKNGRRLLLCFVLRYTNFYREVKKLVDSGRIGEVVSLRASEGVEAWHQGHSFVRGHWGKATDSTPMLVAKSSHDMDIFSWLVGKPCAKIASFGSLRHFLPSAAPDGATARCTDSCPHLGSCLYDAHRYLTDQKRWLEMVYTQAKTASDDEIVGWLKTSDWGRCVYHCDNDVVDHQVVDMEFEGGVTASFTMTAFDSGRHIEIYGTKGVLKGGYQWRQIHGCDLWIYDHASMNTEEITLDGEIGGHQGGDKGLVDSLYDVFTSNVADLNIDGLIEGHLMGFAGEEARRSGMVVDMKEYRQRMKDLAESST